MRVIFVHTGQAFLPEIPAYRNALHASGHQSEVVSSGEAASQITDADVIVRFGGLLRSLKTGAAPEIHEYHSASTQSPRRLRNALKSLLSTRSVGRIFQNQFVRDQFHFPHRAPYIYRDMGAAPEMLCSRSTLSKSFDVIYTGSFKGRHGLVPCILDLAAAGAKIGVAGDPATTERERMAASSNIEFVGRLDAHEVPGFLAAARFGLNFVPDIYPLNRQTSTKVIEYLVAGLPIISNSYAWMDQHSQQLGYTYSAADAVIDIAKLEPAPASVLPKEKVQQLLWPNVLRSCGFVDFVERAANLRVSS